MQRRSWKTLDGIFAPSFSDSAALKIPRTYFRFFRWLAILLVLSASGCQQFVLTDDSATDRILATHYWKDLEKQYSASLACWIVAVKPDARELYIAANKSSHIVRLRVCRVTADGRVWVNDDPNFRADHWILVR